MSKVPEPNAWDARDAFHRATMTVYANLGALVDVLKREPDLRVALLLLDEHASPEAAPESDDPEFVADLKHAAGQLRSSLATTRTIRAAGHRASRIGGLGGNFAGIRTVSHHDALLDAATEALQLDAEGAARSGRTARPQSTSGVIRRQVIEAAMDPVAWARLRTNLEHEYEQTLLLPPRSPDGSKSPDAIFVGAATLQHLRAVLNTGVQVKYSQATRGLEELRSLLQGEDLVALERSLAAEKSLDRAKTEVAANRDSLMRIGGPVFEALRVAGLALTDGNQVHFSGTEAEREQITNAERAKLETALQAARLARDAAPRPEQAIRNAHKVMLPLLRDRLGELQEVLRGHGPLIARPIDQEAPRYGPTVGSHPRHFWTGPSGHDVLAQLVAAVLDTIDGGEDAGIVIRDEEWERLRIDVLRESGELARRVSPAGTAMDDAHVAHVRAGREQQNQLSTKGGVLPQQASTGRPLAAEVRSEHERENQARIPAAQPLTPPTSAPESGSPQFNAAERAIVLLVRDGGHPRSTRDYAKNVGVSHTTLSRNEHWQRAWKAAQEGAKKDANDMPRGSKDGEGNLEAWREEACENCRQEPFVESVTVNDEVVRLCEGCAEKHRPRTS